MVKNLPAMWETWVPSLGWEDPLEKGMVTHSSVLAFVLHVCPKLQFFAVLHSVQLLGSQTVR